MTNTNHAKSDENPFAAPRHASPGPASPQTKLLARFLYIPVVTIAFIGTFFLTTKVAYFAGALGISMAGVIAAVVAHLLESFLTGALEESDQWP